MPDIRPAQMNAVAILATNPLVRAAVLADLRAKVEALSLMWDADRDYEDGYEAAKRDMLGLIDGSSE